MSALMPIDPARVFEVSDELLNTAAGAEVVLPEEVMHHLVRNLCSAAARADRVQLAAEWLGEAEGGLLEPPAFLAHVHLLVQQQLELLAHTFSREHGLEGCPNCRTHVVQQAAWSSRAVPNAGCIASDSVPAAYNGCLIACFLAGRTRRVCLCLCLSFPSSRVAPAQLLAADSHRDWPLCLSLKLCTCRLSMWLAAAYT